MTAARPQRIGHPVSRRSGTTGLPVVPDGDRVVLSGSGLVVGEGRMAF